MPRWFLCVLAVAMLVPSNAQRRKASVAEPATVVYDGLIRQPNPWYVKADSPLAEASVCTGQDKGLPLGVAVILPSDSSRVGLFFLIDGGPPNGRLKLTLRRNFVEVHGARFTVPERKRSIWWVEPKAAWTFREGLYTFELELSGEVLGVLDFVVVSDPELDPETLPEPEYTDVPPPVDEIPVEVIDEVDEVEVGHQMVATADDANGGGLTQEQRDLVAAAFGDASGMTDTVVSEVADEVVTDLRENSPGDAWSAVPDEAYDGAKAGMTDGIAASTQDALVAVQADLVGLPSNQLDPGLAGALRSGKRENLVTAMVDTARNRVTDQLHMQAQNQVSKVSGRSGLLQGVLGVAAGHGVGTVVDFVSGLFGGDKRQPRNFFLCSDLTAGQLAEKMLEAEGVQDAIAACGGRQPEAMGAAGTSDTSKFGRGMMLIPLAPKPNDAALAALLIVDDVAVRIAGAVVDVEQGFPFRFRNDDLYALPLVLNVGAADQGLQVLNGDGQPLLTGAVDVAAPEARAQIPLATVHQVVSMDEMGDTAMVVCSITPDMDYATNAAPVFTLTISRSRR